MLCDIQLCELVHLVIIWWPCLDFAIISCKNYEIIATTDHILNYEFFYLAIKFDIYNFNTVIKCKIKTVLRIVVWMH